MRSGEIHVLNKLAELAVRCGISPIAADIALEITFHEPVGYHYSLSAMQGSPGADELDDDTREARLEKVWALLGLDPMGYREFPDLNEVDKVVDHALSLAPRARIR